MLDLQFYIFAVKRYYPRASDLKSFLRQMVDGNFDDNITSTLSPCRRRKVLLNVLDAIHEETREKLRKSHEKLVA